MTKIYRCKCHGNDYTVCPLCQCQYCPLYWKACPRCPEIKRHAQHIAAMEYASSETAYGRTVNYDFAVKVF